MARPARYNPATVTAQALPVFWQHGYSGSSVDTLVAATGLNKHSLYKAFDGKEGLFRACLQHYIATETRCYFAVLEQHTGLAALRHYFELIFSQASQSTGKGCLVANTVLELGNTSAAVRTLIDSYYQQLANCFCLALQQGQHAGHIKPELNASASAQWLVHIAQGLALSNRLQTPLQGDVPSLLAFIAIKPTTQP